MFVCSIITLHNIARANISAQDAVRNIVKLKVDSLTVDLMEFYQMNSDGIEQERLTFNGIIDCRDDDILIMDSKNINGEGQQKQLTFDPNKDYTPIWIP